MRVLLTICMAVILLFSTNIAHAHRYPERPPLPEVDMEEIVHEIIITDKSQFDTLVEKTKAYSSLKINHIYKHVFPGFSVTGKRRDIQKLKKESGIQHSSPVATYHASLEESVPFIGGEEIRSHFDKNDHRLTGKGVKVGVIDTGVDYTHPDLRRNYKGGSDLVDGDDDPMETKGVEGRNTSHGTHVAGIIAANGKIKGVAPEADIIGYRALGPGGMGTSEQVIAAIDKAIEDKVDVINLSLGNTINGPDWPTSLALDKATEKGIVAVTSSGNSGPMVWTVGSPGTSSKAISVGASTPPMTLPYLTVGFADRKIQLQPLQGSIPWKLQKKYEIVKAGIGTESIFPKAKNKIVLMERGQITFTQKAVRAYEAGAIAVLIYNNTDGNFSGTLEQELPIPVASLSKEDGEWLKKQIKSKKQVVKTSFMQIEDTIASFSSRGPVTHTWAIKPDVVAPGVAIDSTIPNGYQEMQGTSMAAPHVAGASAILKQAHPNWSPEQIKAALMNTARLLEKEDGTLYKPYEQGAGRIQLHEAIHSETLLYPGSFSAGMLHHQDNRTKKTMKITVDNQSDEEKKYSFEVPKSIEGIQWDLPLPFTVKPKQKKIITIGMDITPSTIGAGLHDGNLYLKEGKNRYHIPYMYVIEEPNYPRIMGFQFGKGDQEDVFRYELYLPGGAEEYGIVLYDPDTLRFVTFLDWDRNVARGLVEKKVNRKARKLRGIFKAIIYVKKAGKEDILETEISFEDTMIGGH
ncbi:S8 family serine peptidase [Bacillus timonensis]|uniref:S8 family serine peptidase n=1 Tax=Bacillus timonensis TaxID=1033734 RepID=UPI00030D48EB|nr:S8 family serine peptidase [Bacillus timonensis]